MVFFTLQKFRKVGCHLFRTVSISQARKKEICLGLLSILAKISNNLTVLWGHVKFFKMSEYVTKYGTVSQNSGNLQILIQTFIWRNSVGIAFDTWRRLIPLILHQEQNTFHLAWRTASFNASDKYTYKENISQYCFRYLNGVGMVLTSQISCQQWNTLHLGW